MEGSGNSVEESQRQPINNPENLPASTNVQDITNEQARTNSVQSGHTKETKNNNDVSPTKKNSRSLISGHRKNRSLRKNQETSWTKRTRYKNVQNASSIDSSEKKWWRFLKWLPGLKTLRFPRGSTVPEDRVFDETGNPREELSMTMWNIRDSNEQRPV
ncbi:uncharacterized protein LOC118648206 [Monomorium pharaonis]|nr:uncharacterized protein LOC118648206 [Monomorium pharaonis]